MQPAFEGRLSQKGRDYPFLPPRHQPGAGFFSRSASCVTRSGATIPATQAAEAGLVRTVESTRREVAARRFNMGADGFLTVSAGVAVHGRRRFGSPEALLRAAMLALQSAQREGRNRVGHYRAGYDPLAA